MVIHFYELFSTFYLKWCYCQSKDKKIDLEVGKKFIPQLFCNVKVDCCNLELISREYTGSLSSKINFTEFSQKSKLWTMHNGMNIFYKKCLYL